MAENTWERFEDSFQSRYDSVLFQTQETAGVCEKISPETLYDTAYTLHNLELHCVANKTPGLIHHEDDRKDCGLVFSVGGVYRFDCCGRSCLLENNRILYLPSHSRYTHTFLSPSDRNNPWQSDMIVLNFHLLDPEGTQRILSGEPMLLPTSGERYRQEFLTLTERFLSPDRQPSELIGRVYSILSDLTRELVYENKHRRQYHALSPALELLHTAPPGSLRVEDLIRATYLSPTRFRTLFREYAGMTPHTYLVQHTLRTAIPLLRSTDLTIPEISERLGFDTPSYFGKYIRKHTGQTPRDFQKNK